MSPSFTLDVREEVAEALRHGRPVVALESAGISHGLPWPVNLETARAAEEGVRREGAVPATLAVWQGRPAVGLEAAQLEALARGSGVLKLSRRDLTAAVVQGKTGGATVSASLYLAYRVGLRVCAAGGIGGAHRGSEQSFDISSDLVELSRTPVAVVCAGAKGILDLSRTVEILESYAVPVVGYGTDTFPAFYLRSSSAPVSARVNTPPEAAAFLAAHWWLEGAGVVLAQPVPPEVALEPDDFAHGLLEAERQAAYGEVRGKELTPFLMGRLDRLTRGKTVRANQALVVANARLAAQIARHLAEAGEKGAQGERGLEPAERVTE
jgi:pseudouridine-5'-phosphate glycosidase